MHPDLDRASAAHRHPCRSGSAADQLEVDASEVTRRIIHVKVVVPARPGPLALHYPKWIPGRHRPVGQISNVSGLRVTAGGKTLTWKRDEDDPFTIHVTVPKGATAVEVNFDLLLAAGTEGGAMFMTVASPKVMTMNWNDVLVYPKVRSCRSNCRTSRA